MRSGHFLFRPHVCHLALSLVAIQRSRPLSTSSFDPAVRQFLVKLAEHQPCFSMSSSSVHILHEPRLFYQSLLRMIRGARHRLFISSLYIGTEDIELIDALHTSLHDNPALHLYVHLDLNRSTRPGPRSTAQLLLPLLREHPDRVHVYLFRSPKLKGLLARLVPPRFNEGWGTWHPKIYGADDDVLISGANLNTSYFTNRQDRYLRFTEQPGLAQYCFAFLQAAATFSYSLLPSPTAQDEYTLNWPDAYTHPHQIEKKAKKHLEESDVLVFPIIQAGQFNVREEERCLALLFDALSAQISNPRNTPNYDGPLMDFTSGYFALYKPYQDLILQSRVACRILSASPKANGFYGSKGISGRIPEGYTLFERRFMKAVCAAGREWSHDAPDGGAGAGVQLSEWEKEGWTYHAKGIWLRPTMSSTPNLTLFGSTNLNARSADLDTELSFVLATTAPALRETLAAEADGLRAHAQTWRGCERRVRVGTRALVGVVGAPSQSATESFSLETEILEYFYLLAYFRHVFNIYVYSAFNFGESNQDRSFPSTSSPRQITDGGYNMHTPAFPAYSLVNLGLLPGH
ncbi:CDP-diacylglycerol--glycerol-3-phosphate 3-phosphatidyltransferase [Grifola frondosa]|uniref:CDP-diacylglycerol--glycerol-3-phosphate 3-phosphatidyltransferase n=1 Tax=Grifola frondosa TaxID=5627 RepID=A0A1C7LLS4_GRIFR|nr:CDP-diacylglycerol--glycerol-3-phosphate 3-phosphatidyltransferase [Grifola frondosa]